MSSFKKYGAAILVTVLLIAGAIWLGVDKASTAASDEYKNWVMDEADLLSGDAENRIASYNENLDKKYGSIIGVVSLITLDEKDIEEYSYAVLDGALGCEFGQYDCVLVLAKEEETWYFAYNDEIAKYTNNAFRIAVTSHVDDGMYSNADQPLLAMYEDLQEWYDKNVPTAEVRESSYRENERRPATSGASVLGGLFSFVIWAIILLLVFRYLIFPMFRYTTVGRWRPLWGWGLFGPFRGFRHHHRTHDPPPGGHRHFGGFGSGSRPSSGNRSGFGTGSRGGFGGNSRGGFGGGSRGSSRGSSRGGFGGGKR